MIVCGEGFAARTRGDWSKGRGGCFSHGFEGNMRKQIVGGMWFSLGIHFKIWSLLFFLHTSDSTI